METTNIRQEINYKGFNNEYWKMLVTFDNEITVICNGEKRTYKLNDIVHIEHDNDYVTITHPDNSFTQIKFELDNFLVIDLFDADSEYIETIGSYVFGE
jgi:hypothetical protein